MAPPRQSGELMLADIGSGLSRRTALKGLGAAGVVSLVSSARLLPALAQ